MTMNLLLQACELGVKIYTNTPVACDNEDEHGKDGNIHMLLCALDYKKTNNSLTCSLDGKNMEDLARQCGVRDVVAMYDEQCTSPAVAAQIEQMGDRCQDGDYFIFYYSGHGTNLQDMDGDEEDGQDEALCFVDEQGQISYNTCMSDDTFAELVTTHVPPGCRILILTDCCHSGTIADLNKGDWSEHEAISVTGCMDNQTSGDMGKGGIFTHSMLVAIQKLMEGGDDDFSVGMLYNSTLKYDEVIFHSEQDISIQSTSSIAPNKMAWPLVPPAGYMSPMMKAKRALSLDADDEDGQAAEAAAANPQALAQAGVSPEIMNNIATLSDGKLNIEDIKAASKMAAGCAIM